MPAEEGSKDTSGKKVTFIKKRGGEWVRISTACGRDSQQLVLLKLKWEIERRR